MNNPYETLGVEKTATAEDIKRAYRKKAHEHHPDKDSGNEDEFKKVNAAYQVLSDDEKRSQYDQFGDTFDGAGAGGSSGFGGFNVNAEDFGGVGDIFEQFFGGRSGQTRERVRRGDDIQIDVTISFLESAVGVNKDVTTRLHQTCSKCSGDGAEPGTPITECSTCSGQGTVSTTRQTMLGTFAQTSVCPTCHGDGKQAETNCSQCRGEGRELRDRTLEISVPAGIADGQTIRLSGKGSVPERGGVAGDLYIIVHVAAEKHLERDGNNVRSDVSISFVDAALGKKIEIDSLRGKQRLDVPAGTQPGTEIRLNELGFPGLGGGSQGDHIVTVLVVIPKKLSKKQKELLKGFEGAKSKLFN